MNLPKTTKVTIYLDADQAQLLRDWFEQLQHQRAFLTPGMFALDFLPAALIEGAVKMRAEAPRQPELEVVHG